MVSLSLYVFITVAGFLSKPATGFVISPTATVTLYDVIEPNITYVDPEGFYMSVDEHYEASPISVAGDGKTIYEDVAIINGVVIVDPMGPTHTLTSGYPRTTTITYAEDSAGYEMTRVWYEDGKTMAIECHYEGTTRGFCVERDYNLSETSTTTFTGSVTPLTTLELGPSPTEALISEAQARWRIPALVNVIGVGLMGAILTL